MAATTLVALAFAAAACGGDDDGDDGATGETKSVYMEAYAQEIQFFRDWHDGAMSKGEEFAWEMTSEFGNNDPAQQVSQIENALVQQPEGILVTPLDAESLTPVLERAKDQGVGIVTVGSNIADESVPDSFVSKDNEEVGRMKAEYVVEQLDGEGTVGIIHGIRGLTFSEDQAQGFEAVLGEEPDIQVVDGPFAGGFSADLGLETTENLLTRAQNLDAIIYDNDDLALGGVEALKGRGVSPDEIIIVGSDGGDAALDAVARGDIDMTIANCGYQEGINAAEALNEFFETGEGPERVVTEVEVLTTEDVEERRVELTESQCLAP